MDTPANLNSQMTYLTKTLILRIIQKSIWSTKQLNRLSLTSVLWVSMGTML